MGFKEFFETEKAQKQIDKLAKKYKNKKVVIYGAGQYCRCLFENYNLSKLNIIAVADKKYETDDNCDFYGLKCIAPEELKEIDCDIILLGVYDTFYFLDFLEDELLVDSKNKNVKIKPIIKQSFFGFLKSLFSDD